MDFTRLDELRSKLQSLRPLTQTELKRLQEDFIVENTYHSNAIEGNSLTLRETAYQFCAAWACLLPSADTSMLTSYVK